MGKHRGENQGSVVHYPSSSNVERSTYEKQYDDFPLRHASENTDEWNSDQVKKNCRETERHGAPSRDQN